MYCNFTQQFKKPYYTEQKRYDTEQMESNLQNGKKIKMGQIYLNKQGTKNQCQVEADQLEDFFCFIGKKSC